mmetsp:Transcript_20597/g.30225  ORF Transcript_20597/g.30225 Transcript_20597/m.30225 type:complete len:110 (-) Transcript_20597:1486-1815(-)
MVTFMLLYRFVPQDGEKQNICPMKLLISIQEKKVIFDDLLSNYVASLRSESFLLGFFSLFLDISMTQREQLKNLGTPLGDFARVMFIWTLCSCSFCRATITPQQEGISL